MIHTSVLSMCGLAGMAAGLMINAGCSSGSPADRIDSNQAAEYDGYSKGLESLDAGRQLEMLAEREAINPSEPQRDLVNQLMQGRLVELRPGTQEYTNAHRSLSEVLTETLDGISAPVETEIPLLPQIAKGYVRARAALMNDDPLQAISIYEQLQQASPNSTEILVGLGDAYVRAGDRAKATQAYLQAVDLGDRSMRALVYGAMGASGDPDRVIELGSLVWEQENTMDVSGRLLGGVMLGQSLLETGSLAAGAEVMESALDLLDGQTVRDPRYRRELVQLYTKRAEQYASLGDAWMLLDRPDRAMEQYTRASGLVENNPRELAVRTIAANLLSGHSAIAAMDLLDWVDANPGNDSVLAQNMVATVGQHPLVGGILLESLAARSNDASRPVAHRQAILGMLLSMTQSPQQGADLLATSSPEIVSPVACARVLGGIETTQAKLNAAMDIIERSPSAGAVVVPALIRVDGNPLVLLAGVEGDSQTAQLVRCLITLDLQRPDHLGSWESITDAPLEDRSTAWITAHARASVLSGRWGLADTMLEVLRTRESGMNGSEWFFYVDTLVTANRPDDATAAVDRRVSRPDTNATDWLVCSRIAQTTGDLDRALEALNRAIDLDPYNETVYEQLITLRSPAGAFADVDELRSVTRSLGQRLPESALIKLLRAHELAGASGGAQGGTDAANAGQGAALLIQSERTLLEAHELHPYRQIGNELLLSVWATKNSQGQQGTIPMGIEWVRRQQLMMPGSVELAGSMARLLVLNGDPIGAEGYLDGFYERVPSRAVGRLHEGLIRSDETRRLESDEIALSRLDGLLSVGDCLERLERAGGIGRLTDYNADLLIPSEGRWEFGSVQALRVVRTLGAIAQANTDPSVNDLLLTLIDRAKSRSVGVDPSSDEGTIDPIAALNQIEVVARPGSNGFTLDGYSAFVRSLIEANPENTDTVTLAVQSVLRARDSADALAFFTTLIINTDGTLDQQKAVDLVSFMGQIGTSGDVDRMIETLDESGALVDARDTIVSSLQTLDEENWADESDPGAVRADLTYTIGVIASFYEREDAAHDIYRLALSYDEDHAWANNDLGYQLAERGENLDEAERLLITAHAAQPGAASITDSLAWARYAIGVFENETHPDGSIIREGARELLVEAIALDDTNATMHDHLGDVLWMLGEFAQATESWLTAEDLLRARLTDLSNQSVANPRAVESIREELSTIRFKISDAESGRAPRVGKNNAGIEVPADDTIMD